MLTETNEMTAEYKRERDLAEKVERQQRSRLKGKDQFSPDMQAAFDKIFGSNPTEKVE